MFIALYILTSILQFRFIEPDSLGHESDYHCYKKNISFQSRSQSTGQLSQNLISILTIAKNKSLLNYLNQMKIKHNLQLR
jgi:hypothetical protein